MNRLPSPHDPHESLERLHQLLADRALFGLAEAESAELERLLQTHPEADAEAYDLAAAAADLALSPTSHEPLPAHVQQRIRATRLHDAAARDGQAPASSPPSRVALRPVGERRSRASAREWLGWIVAAACLVIAVSFWNANGPGKPPALAEQRQQLIAAGATKLDWTATADAAASGASGDVVWNNAAQQGYMRFRGLAANDPQVEQYQLWIFDAAQDERYPIDGGVFDVDPATGDVIVPIRPAIRVVDPKMFAITVEKPGGVVVSSRERIALLAKGT